MATETGLRERKKAQTRAALASAAMRLALERGVENVTADAIAEAADVSPRTFRNYFSGKEEAIVAELVDGMGHIADGLRARPADEPLWESLRHALTFSAFLPPEQLEQLAVKVRMVMASRSLLGSQLAIFERLGEQLTEVIAERTGTDASRDLYPRLTGVVAANALRLAVFMWLESEGDSDLAELTADALARLRAGLPEP
ncbi:MULTISPECIES: TetR/AcrR family transcriptional regulator [unclassified Streptomyces]|uniref:TetR/AcrR family transcriptional regulator n=1 Tax=unclassified Streptomyces TaxID=2593676 RepID=UPI0019099DA2|nr:MULTISPECIES: TetR family transcriptional regulator [unclassified Streptomyces]MBK3569726.1 TetR family transcriptional regulator [Streptomyces sp. MBT62]MBK6015874.1 TetR family transcriptional regulator [Streptomyces sp. MBT53]